MERERLQELSGHQLVRIFGRLGGDQPKPRSHVDLSSTGNVFVLFRDFVGRVQDASAKESIPLVISLVAAGRLLTGDLAGAEIIVDPFRRVRMLEIMGPATAWSPRRKPCFMRFRCQTPSRTWRVGVRAPMIKRDFVPGFENIAMPASSGLVSGGDLTIEIWSRLLHDSDLFRCPRSTRGLRWCPRRTGRLGPTRSR